MKYFITMYMLTILFFQDIRVSSNIQSMTMKLIKKDVLPLPDYNRVKCCVSLINCAAKCNQNSSCKSFAYNGGKCWMYENDYSKDDTQLESAEGSFYYSIYENLMESSPTSQPRTTELHLTAKAFKETKKISWDEARRNCENKGGNLVSILNRGIQNKVVEAMKEVGIEDGAWIGLRGMNKNNDFQWLEGTVLRGTEKGMKTENPFQLWHKFNPDNSDKDIPVRILGPKYEQNEYTWADEQPVKMFNSYVCQFIQ